MSWLMALGLIASVQVGETARPETGPISKPTQPATRLSESLVAELIAQLGDRRWEVRDHATAGLKVGGPNLFDRLAEAYQSSRQPEVRLRIKEVVEHIFLTAGLKSTGGFLGIRQRVVGGTEDARIPAGQAGILVVEALPGTAAAQAGLRAGDVIVALNGEGLKIGQNQEEFGRRISRFEQGTGLMLTVLRADKHMDVHVTLGARPFEHAEWRPEDVGRMQKQFWALWRSRFDPNDRNLNMAEAVRPELVWPDRLPDWQGREAGPGE